MIVILFSFAICHQSIVVFFTPSNKLEFVIFSLFVLGFFLIF
jgi:hypothetical protein